MPHFIIVLILYINLFNLSWIKKNAIFEEHGAFNLLLAGRKSATRRFVLWLAFCYFVLVIFCPFSTAITSLREERASLGALL